MEVTVIAGDNKSNFLKNYFSLVTYGVSSRALRGNRRRWSDDWQLAWNMEPIFIRTAKIYTEAPILIPAMF